MRIGTTNRIFALMMGLGLAACTAGATEPTPSARATPAAPASVAQSANLVCNAPLRRCVRCDGSGQFCAIRCPECAPLLAPRDGTEVSSLTLATSSRRADGCEPRSGEPQPSLM